MLVTKTKMIKHLKTELVYDDYASKEEFIEDGIRLGMCIQIEKKWMLSPLPGFKTKGGVRFNSKT